MADEYKTDDAPAAPILEGARVIIVIGPLELGGAERQAILLAGQLAREQRAEVEVWGHGAPGRAAELCAEQGIAWRSVELPVPWSPDRLTQFKRLAKFARALRRAKPDVILPFMFFQSVACGIVWRLTGARLCVWNQRDEGRDRLGRLSEGAAVRLTPYFVANSGHGADFLVEKLGAPRARVRVVHNGVALPPPRRGRGAWREELGVGEDCFLACMLANLHAFKDHVTLLKAWPRVVERLGEAGRRAVLILAGRFDDTHESLKALAFDLGLGRSVRFVGQVKDVSGLLSAVDLGVFSSVKEGCPNGVLECMAAGLAVVGTDYEGIREAVGPRGYALLAPPGDHAALAERIVNVALDEDARREAGEANRTRIETEFSPRGMYRGWLSVIEEGLRENKGARTASPDAVALAEKREAR
jgi:glycosyltransferase involved in cell wall biosynthesis